MHIALDQMSLTYPDGTMPVSGLSLTIPAGQFCALLGRSGAGKSSLLRLLGGIAAPTGGSASIDGTPLTAAMTRALRKRIGQVHQDSALVGEASVADNIVAGAAAAMPLWRALSGLYPAWARERAVALHQELGLDPAFLAAPVARLSGGQQQRVGVARALMLEPALILADEPVASVDPDTARQVLSVLATYRTRLRATVVCALHQPELACAFADRILVMEEGRLAFDGSPELYRRSHRVEAA